jgi:hypothetical protein
MKPGTTGAINTPTLTPASRSCLQRVSRARLERRPRCLVHRRDAQIDRGSGGLAHVGEDVPVADDHRSLRDQADGRAAAVQRFERTARQLVVAFDWLVRIRRSADRHLLADPRVMVELIFQDLDQVRLHEDDRRELVPWPELELRLVAPGETVVAGVRTAAIGVQRPVEGHPLHAVQGRPAGDLLVASRVRSELGLVEGR